MSLLTPGLFLAGSLLVAGPIIIHLLNRRRYKRLDWAAMEFLLQASRKRRQRIRLEDLLLLLLRCAAVVLIALLVARPFLTAQHGGGWLDSARYQRIVLLDDSLSMSAAADGRTVFDEAKDSLAQMAKNLASQRSGDALRLFVTSRSATPVITVDGLTDETLGDVLDQIQQLKPSPGAARFADAVADIQRSFDPRSTQLNRLVYVVTDLRRRDWGQRSLPDGTAAKGDATVSQEVETDAADAETSDNPEQSGLAALGRLADNVAGCFLLDFGDEGTGNVAVAEIVPTDRVLASGVPAQFDVVLRNLGQQAVEQLEVRFTGEGSLPITQNVAAIPAGGRGAVQVRYAFPAPPEDDDVAVPPVPIRVELSTGSGEDTDRVAGDNVRHLAARVVRGIRTLIVDGDPSSSRRRSESYFLQRALSPPGDARAGIQPEVVGPSEFETVTLDDYQVVFLCNLEVISPPRRESLESWVRSGGGLIIAPGDQLYDPANFNAELYREGNGLAPLALRRLGGGESETRWVNLRPVVANHEILRLYEGDNNPLLELVKVFRWWQADTSMTPAVSVKATVLARFTDDQQSPAIVERRFGSGRVILITTPLDKDWSNWPQEPAGSIYVAMMQDITRYVARTTVGEGEIPLGQPLRYFLDLTKFQRTVRLQTPDGQSHAIQPAPLSAADMEDTVEGAANRPPDKASWLVQYDNVDQTGFYTLQLQCLDGTTENVLFAVNVDVDEGDLTPIDRAVLESELEGTKIQLAGRDDLAKLSAASVRREYWKYVIGLIACVLCGELLLGWALGQKRQ